MNLKNTQMKLILIIWSQSLIGNVIPENKENVAKNLDVSQSLIGNVIPLMKFRIYTI